MGKLHYRRRGRVCVCVCARARACVRLVKEGVKAPHDIRRDRAVRPDQNWLQTCTQCMLHLYVCRYIRVLIRVSLCACPYVCVRIRVQTCNQCMLHFHAQMQVGVKRLVWPSV